MVNILTRAIMMSTPLLLGALAEVYAERTGMMICAIEGIFLIGAWGGFVGTYLSGSLLVGLLLAIALGGLMALLYAFVTVTLGQQQVVTGTAMNILAVGFCSYFQRVLFGVPTTPLQIDTLPKLSIPLLSKIPSSGRSSSSRISSPTWLISSSLCPSSCCIRPPWAWPSVPPVKIPWPWMWRACR